MTDTPAPTADLRVGIVMALHTLASCPPGPWTFDVFVDGERCPDITTITMDVQMPPGAAQPHITMHFRTEARAPRTRDEPAP